MQYHARTQTAGRHVERISLLQEHRQRSGSELGEQRISAIPSADEHSLSHHADFAMSPGLVSAIPTGPATSRAVYRTSALSNHNTR